MFAEYTPTEALIDSHFIAAGVRLHHTVRIAFDPVALTPEQRTVLTRCEIKSDYKTNDAYYIMPHRTTGVRQMYRDSGPASYDTERADKFDTLPTIAEWIERAANALASRDQFVAEFDRLAARHASQEKSNHQAQIDDATEKLLGYIARRVTKSSQPAGMTLKTARELGCDMSRWDAAVAKYEALEPAFRAEQSEREAAEKAAAEARREALRAEKRAWADQHGSDRLKRNLALGNDCKRLYTIERAAIEFPGFTPDIEDTGAFKPITCASIEALDERDAVIAAHPEIAVDDVLIRWLTSAPSARKLDEREAEYYESEFKPCECIAIEHPHLGWLIKAL